MKWILLGLPTFAAYVAACGTAYNFCHCYDDNKLPNNNATKKVCDANWGQLKPNKLEYPNQDPPYTECHVTDFSITSGIGWNNCNWRKACAAAGATGDDSSCDY